MATQSDPITLECCACGERRTFHSGDDIYSCSWALHESKDKRIDLCTSCSKRQDGREEQERQILGLPAQKIEPMKKNEGPSAAFVQSVAQPVSGITVRAVFKLDRIDAIVGDNLISGEMLPDDAVEVIGKIDSKVLTVGRTYFINLVK